MLPNWLTKKFLSHDSHFYTSDEIIKNGLNYELIFIEYYVRLTNVYNLIFMKQTICSDLVIINRNHLNFVCGKIWSQNHLLTALVQTFKHTIFHNNEDPKDLSEDIKELASSSAEYFFKNKHICLGCPFVMCLVFCDKYT